MFGFIHVNHTGVRASFFLLRCFFLLRKKDWKKRLLNFPRAYVELFIVITYLAVSSTYVDESRLVLEFRSVVINHVLFFFFFFFRTC